MCKSVTAYRLNTISNGHVDNAKDKTNIVSIDPICYIPTYALHSRSSFRTIFVHYFLDRIILCSTHVSLCDLFTMQSTADNTEVLRWTDLIISEKFSSALEFLAYLDLAESFRSKSKPLATRSLLNVSSVGQHEFETAFFEVYGSDRNWVKNPAERYWTISEPDAWFVHTSY